MSVTIKLTGAAAASRQLERLANDFPKDAARALNTTARRSATRVRRRIAADIGLPQKVIKNKVQHFKASARRLRASVWVGTRAGIPLGSVPGARTTLTGVLRAGRIRQQTFRARMPSGHVGQFVRKPGAKHRTRPDGQRTQLPIEEPKVRIGVRARPIVIEESTEQMRSFYPREFRRLVKRTVDRRTKRKTR